MYISEVLKMPEFNSFRLVTKNSGESKALKNIGIHDYESLEQIPKAFGNGDFVLTTLFVCKDSEADLEKYICALLDANISAIAIKEVFYKEIPCSCINKADELGIPILFYPMEIMAEDIIVNIKSLINNQNRYREFENKIERILGDQMGEAELKEFANLINKNSYKKIGAVYAKKKIREERQLLDDCKKLEDIIAALPVKDEIHLGKFADGILLFISYSDYSKCRSILKSLLNMVNGDEYWIGHELSEFNYSLIREAISNSITAAKVSSIEKLRVVAYDDIGIYKMLLPMENNKGLFKQCEEFIKLIKEHDEKYNLDFFETGEIYIDNDGDIIKTAEDMHQHPNTVRYRINKLKQLISNENDGYVQLYLTMKVNKINENMRVK